MKKCIDFNQKVYRNGKVLYDWQAFETWSGLFMGQLFMDIPKYKSVQEEGSQVLCSAVEVRLTLLG